MSSFGCTSLGPSQPVLEGTAGSQAYIFHTLPLEHYHACFIKYLIGPDSQIALTLEIDGSIHILRASLGDMLRELLGRPPRKFELDTWFTFLDFDRSPLLGEEEFMSQVEKLVHWSANPQDPKQYKSSVRLHTDWVKHARVDYSHQQTLKAPMTTQQEIGWHTAKPGPARVSHALNQTDVTLREGHNQRSYYGHFIVDK